MRAGSREGEGEGRAGGGAAALAALAQAPSLSRRERLPSRRAAATRARRRRLVAHPRTCRKVESTPAADACKDPCVACGRRARRAPGVLAPVASDNHARALQWFACAPHNRPGPGVRVAGRHAREEEELETHRCTCKKKKKETPPRQGLLLWYRWYRKGNGTSWWRRPSIARRRRERAARDGRGARRRRCERPPR